MVFRLSHVHVAATIMLASRLRMHLQTGNTLHVTSSQLLHVRYVGRPRWPSSGGIGAK